MTERTFTVVVSVLVAHTAWHWTTERAQEFWSADWTALDAVPFVASAIGLAIVAALAAAGLRALTAQQHRRRPRLQDS